MSPLEKYLGLDSILKSVKKQLGVPIQSEEFDQDLVLLINADIVALCQIGVGPKEGFTVESENDTYGDWLGDDPKVIALVKQHIAGNVRLRFDPPSSSIVAESIKEMVREAECRLSYQVDGRETFE